ncbi:CYTH domain-containing protein [Microbacterium resistens]|uniref:CYTH domain-containing protein n=1 Tax=Microbacterium resistens TaxID=156977 RepID=A0ABY3RSM4_9MICO|nr:CYTH domain-containing protein [Microbacterium resistens]MBW1637586.1 CYTH domain-containing protein [Microbacterium resistens]MDA4895094.1 CYTH domain-containing protein [Streptomyces sp. MS2A]UGS27073.1 CYTH domain-containing protein [Microbacterium resistens]
MTEPQRTVEVERTYDVDADTPLPDWSGVPGVLEVGAGERRALDARYLDTADAALARAGVAVRRRTGGPDEGWHVKGPRDGDARIELGWPLGENEEPPSAVREALTRWTSEPLLPFARIENSRTAYQLRGAEGVVAEFVDDRVRATDVRGGVERSWREWEVELGPAGPTDPAARTAFFAAVERAVHAAGGRAASSDSKLARALGH